MGQRRFGVQLLHPLAILACPSLVQGLARAMATAAASVSYALIEAPSMKLGRAKAPRLRVASG